MYTSHDLCSIEAEAVSKNPSSFYQTDSGKSILSTLGDYDSVINESQTIYIKILNQISSELITLMNERNKLFKEGGKLSDIEQATKNLLEQDVVEILAKRGFLPRYAFPLDVVSLVTGWSRWTSDAEVELNRDRGIAIAEFAPSAQVIAHKKVFTSAGLYIMGDQDRPKKNYFSICPECKQINTASIKDGLLGNCRTCNRTITSQYIKSYVEPSAFSISIDKKSTKGTRLRRSTLVRQRHTITNYIDYMDNEEFISYRIFKIALNPNGKLFRYNLGPQKKGFVLCPSCGYSVPEIIYKARKHNKLRVISGSKICNERVWTNQIAYGHEFRSYCLIIRPINIPIPVESLSFALQLGLCKFLNVESYDIGVSWRWLDKKKPNAQTEIILYDKAPGGSGFVKDGFENWNKVVEAAFTSCDNCKCMLACYDCLKNYNNQTYHEDLNRKSVIKYMKNM